MVTFSHSCWMSSKYGKPCIFCMKSQYLRGIEKKSVLGNDAALRSLRSWQRHESTQIIVDQVANVINR